LTSQSEEQVEVPIERTDIAFVAHKPHLRGSAQCMYGQGECEGLENSPIFASASQKDQSSC